MDWHITLSGSSPDPKTLLEGDLSMDPDAAYARDHDVARKAADLVEALRKGGHAVDRADFSAGHIKGGSIDLLGSDLREPVIPVNSKVKE
jgi:hypothetical protein